MRIQASEVYGEGKEEEMRERGKRKMLSSSPVGLLLGSRRPRRGPPNRRRPVYTILGRAVQLRGRSERRVHLRKKKRDQRKGWVAPSCGHSSLQLLRRSLPF